MKATGPVWKTILEVAASQHASAIVIGSRGLTGLGSMLLGSVSTAVVHHADRPTLVVHCPGDDASSVRHDRAPGISVEPWSLGETELDLDVVEQAGSGFALANGHVGLRGSLDKGEPPGPPGTYLNFFYEQRQLPYAEAAYGYPESGQTLIDVTNGKIVCLLVDTGRLTGINSLARPGSSG